MDIPESIDFFNKHDVYGRRSEKKVDGFSTRYVYDGPQVIAEYDGNNNLLRKYIYGPGIDQPVCMIEVADSNAVYYYHYDGLGSVVALSDSSGDTVQTYEYSVYGQVAVEDANHPNPYMFAGRRYDIEIGLYYNRTRYYNPYTGRFLQTDPIGYNDGINWYRYCRNNPLGYVDPLGLEPKLKRNGAGKIIGNYPGWANDVWIRPSGHDDPFNWPVISCGLPYYAQTFRMGCVPVAILNWMLTYDVNLVGLPDDSNDRDAETHIGDLIDSNRDWDLMGGNLTEALGAMNGVGMPGPITSIIGLPTAADICGWVNAGRAVMTGFELTGTPGSYHCISIVPTPADYFEARPDLDTNKTISVLDGQSSVGPITYTVGAFTAWWNEHISNGVWGGALVGPSLGDSTSGTSICPRHQCPRSECEHIH